MICRQKGQKNRVPAMKIKKDFYKIINSMSWTVCMTYAKCLFCTNNARFSFVTYNCTNK